MKKILMVWVVMKEAPLFFWRHLFTLIVLSLAVQAFHSNAPILSRVLITLLGAVIIDWGKMKIKVTPSSHRHSRWSEGTSTAQSKNPGNYHMVGTSTNLSGMGHRI